MTAPTYLYSGGRSRHICDETSFILNSLCGLWLFNDEGMVADELASKRRGDPEQRIAHNRALPVCRNCQRIWDNRSAS